MQPITNEHLRFGYFRFKKNKWNLHVLYHGL